MGEELSYCQRQGPGVQLIDCRVLERYPGLRCMCHHVFVTYISVTVLFCPRLCVGGQKGGVIKAQMDWCQPWKRGSHVLPSTQPSSLLHSSGQPSVQKLPMLPDSKDLHFTYTNLAVPQPRARPGIYLMNEIRSGIEVNERRVLGSRLCPHGPGRLVLSAGTKCPPLSLKSHPPKEPPQFCQDGHSRAA